MPPVVASRMLTPVRVSTPVRSRSNAEPNLDAGNVAVEFAILEGLQQILREVTTQGATRTRDGVVRRALRLRIGAPVNLAEWSQARKRMYDTNVFRQVDIEPVPVEPTTEESAAGIQPVRAVVRLVEYPVWRLHYGAQFNDERSEVPDADGDTRLQNIGILADIQNQNVFGRAITAGIAARYERSGRPAACSRRTARSLACRFGRAGLCSPRGSASSIRR